MALWGVDVGDTCTVICFKVMEAELKPDLPAPTRHTVLFDCGELFAPLHDIFHDVP
jgi:hypothetical protein